MLKLSNLTTVTLANFTKLHLRYIDSSISRKCVKEALTFGLEANPIASQKFKSSPYIMYLSCGTFWTTYDTTLTCLQDIWRGFKV